MKTTRLLLWTVALAICTSCTMAQPPPPAAGIGDSFAPSTGFVARAVVAGLTFVDPLSYKGWDGKCPGCDVDAETFTLMCVESGVQVETFHNAAATRQNLLDAARRAWADMKPGDLFIFYISGHGGQENDIDGDEEDGQDETLCLWDGPLSDDVLRALWNEVPAGVRVFMVSDTCHSGSNFRYKPRSLQKSIPDAFKGGLIHYGGCADGFYSYGSSSGGTFTTALVDGWSATNTYVSWFAAAAATMPKNQIPSYSEWGNVTDEFRHAPVFK
jgi:hypothetical protein